MHQWASGFHDGASFIGIRYFSDNNVLFTSEISHELRSFVYCRISTFPLAHLSFKIRQAVETFAGHPSFHPARHFSDILIAVFI